MTIGEYVTESRLGVLCVFGATVCSIIEFKAWGFTTVRGDSCQKPLYYC